MPIDFEIQRCTRRCAGSGRDLAEGEIFYSVLIVSGGSVVRHDYAADAWPGPPAGSLGWWKSQIPSREAKKSRLAPSDVLLEFFAELEGQPGQEEMRYVLALLLIRRRVLRMEEADERDPHHLSLYCPRQDKTYRAAVAMPSEARAAEIQEELGRLLFAGAP